MKKYLLLHNYFDNQEARIAIFGPWGIGISSMNTYHNNIMKIKCKISLNSGGKHDYGGI